MRSQIIYSIIDENEILNVKNLSVWKFYESLRNLIKKKPIKGEAKKEIFAAIACICHGSAKSCTTLAYFNNSFLKKHFLRRTFLYLHLYNYLLCSILTHVVFDFERFAIYRWQRQAFKQ